MKHLQLLGIMTSLALGVGCGGGNDNPEPSCTITDNGDGSHVITCGEDSVTVGGGETPMDTSCTVTDNGDGTQTVACPDGNDVTVGNDNSCTVADNGDETFTLTCDDGTSATFGGESVATVSGTIAAGGTLSLSHGFSDAFVNAQYTEAGEVRALADYVNLHSPIVGTPVRNFSSGGSLSGHDGIVLANGNYVLYDYDEFLIVQPDGTEVLPWTDVTDASSDLSAAVLGDGFVVGYNTGGFPSSFELRYYDNTGADVGFAGGTLAVITIPDYNGTAEITSTNAGGFAVGGFFDDAAGEATRRVMRFDMNGAPVGTDFEAPVSGTSSYVGLRALGGDLLVMVYKENNADGDDAIRASVIDAAGTEMMVHELGGTYLGDHVGIERAPNGHVITAYELGGPDAFAFAVFDDMGNMLAGPTTITGYEPDEISVGVFGDGDFLVGMVEDDSSAGLAWNVRNDGRLVHSVPMHFGGGFEPDYRWFMAPSGDHEVTMTYDVYSDPSSYMVRINKNYLTLDITSATEATVTNFSASDVDVVIGAFGSN